MDETEVHEMQGYSKGRVTVWNCPICGREIAFISVGEQVLMLVLEEGNAPQAKHRGSMGLTIGAVLVSETTPDPFEQWAEEVDLPTALDSD